MWITIAVVVVFFLTILTKFFIQRRKTQRSRTASNNRKRALTLIIRLITFSLMKPRFRFLILFCRHRDVPVMLSLGLCNPPKRCKFRSKIHYNLKKQNINTKKKTYKSLVSSFSKYANNQVERRIEAKKRTSYLNKTRIKKKKRFHFKRAAVGCLCVGWSPSPANACPAKSGVRACGHVRPPRTVLPLRCSGRYPNPRPRPRRVYERQRRKYEPGDIIKANTEGALYVDCRCLFYCRLTNRSS